MEILNRMNLIKKITLKQNLKKKCEGITHVDTGTEPSGKREPACGEGGLIRNLVRSKQWGGK